MIKITHHDDGTATVELPAYVFEVADKEPTAETLVESTLQRLREELEDHFELHVSFVEKGLS